MFRYTALGDSITAGLAATSPAFAYPDQIAATVPKLTRTCTVSVLAESGWTSGDLESAVLQSPVAYLTHANAISIWVGGDDLIHAALQALQTRNLSADSRLLRGAIAHYGQELGRLAGTIRRVSSARLVICTQYNPFPNSPLAGEAIGMLNAATTTVASSLGARIAPTEAWFAGREPELIRGYKTGRVEDVLRGIAPVHPNNRGHKVIADNMVPLLLP